MVRTRAALLLVLHVGLIAWAVLPAASASVSAPDARSEAAFVSDVNAARTSRGLSGLQVAADLVADARQHAEAMASQQRMFDDPALASHVQGGQAVAENSGEGPSVDSVNAAFMASPSHRDNILGPYSQVGVGVVWTGSTLWVAEVFRQPFPSASPQPAPTTAAPITAPPTTAPPTTTLPVAVRAAARPAQARTRAVVRPAAVTPQVVEPAASPKPPPTTTPPTTSPPPAAALGFALPLPTASPSTVELGSTRPAPPHLPATLVVGAALLILIDVTAAGRVWTRRGGVVV